MPTSRPTRSHHQVLASASRVAVLEVLRQRGQALDVDQLSAEVGLHVNTVRGHLDVLIEAGYVIRRSLAPSGPGRPRVVYEASAAPEQDSNYRLLAEMLTGYLMQTSPHPAQDAADAGRSWAAPRVGTGVVGDRGAMNEQVALDAVLKLLADSGFAPQLSADRSRIDLHHCPFRDLAQTHPDVVCGAHLGILQGAFAELGAPVQASRLLPLVEPDLCVATLQSRPA